MTRIKSVWFKRGTSPFTEQFARHSEVCENGIWLTALFWFCERNVRWERMPFPLKAD